MKMLNLYAGLGGNRLLWEGVQVFAVEMNPQIAAVYRRLYPKDQMLEGDAHAELLRHFDKVDGVWSSPPCQRRTRMVKFTRHKLRRYTDLRLEEEVMFLQEHCKDRPWVVENVVSYFEPFIKPTVKIGRHLFWTNFPVPPMEHPKPPSNFINRCNLEGKRAMMDWLGIHFEENIYYDGNHCPAQVLRNCVHPLVGKHVLDAGMRHFSLGVVGSFKRQETHLLESDSLAMEEAK